MKKETIISLILAGGLIAGTGFGIRVLANDTQSTQLEQEQVESTRMQAPWAGFFKGRGGEEQMGGCFMSNLSESDFTVDQEKELNGLRTQAQNIMLDYREKQFELSKEVDAAIRRGNREEILATWSKQATMHDEIQNDLLPVKNSLQDLVGGEASEWNLLQNGFESSPRAEMMTALNHASSEKEVQDIIKDLQQGGMGRRHKERSSIDRGGNLTRKPSNQRQNLNGRSLHRSGRFGHSKMRNGAEDKGMGIRPKGLGRNCR